MAIGHFIKEIGRGKDGAKALSRADSCNLMGQLLDGSVSDLETGAFCLAMRIKGETTEEMCGFLDAVEQRMQAIQIIPTHKERPAVVIPTYNGARKLPGLTTLLALLLAREGFPVVLHGAPTEDKRVFTSEILQATGVEPRASLEPVHGGEVAFFPTRLLHGGLQRLLDVRRVVQLRNPAHSLVKLLSPCAVPHILVTSYTHPEYAVSMEQVLCERRATALLLRGTEGEAVADPRRIPKMTSIAQGQVTGVLDHQGGTLASMPDIPAACDAAGTARYIRSVMDGSSAVPTPIALQVQQVINLAQGVEI